MQAERVSQIIREDVSKDHLIDLADEARACRKLAAKKTLELGLTGRSAHRLAGMATFELMETRLFDLTQAAGGLVLAAGCFPGTALRNYQPLARHRRVLIGRASIGEIGAVPSRNYTRTHGAQLNWPYAAQTYLEGLEPPSPGDLVYALLLTCRDRQALSELAQIALGVLKPDLSGFIMYESIDRFLEGYSGITASPGPIRPDDQPLPLALKPRVQPFVGGESGQEDHQKDEGAAS